MPPTTRTLAPRIADLPALVPAPFQAIGAFYASIDREAVPPAILELVHLRASQINGCSFCVRAGSTSARASGENDDRLFTVAAWREAPYFDDAERAALALAEAVTRLADRPDPVPDEIWDELARHFDERGLMAIVLMVAVTNVFNRVNVSTRQLAGSWG
ncbi:MAG: carboxymuconolactone decarboxylase family protein [Acidimicrobiales bacterium]